MEIDSEQIVFSDLDGSGVEVLKQLKMPKIIKTVRTILPLMQFYPWGIPAIVFLGTAASMAEGVGLGLLIPFLQNLKLGDTPATNYPVIGVIDRYLAFLDPQQRVFVLAASILLAIFIKILLSFAYTALCSWLQFHTLHQLRISVFKQLFEVRQSFWDTSRNGQLLNLINQETFTSSRALAFAIWALINLCTIIILGLLLVLISWKLTVLVGLAFSLISGAVQVLTLKIEPAAQKALRASIDLSNLTIESFTGIKTIRAFGRENHEKRRYQKASQQELRASLKQETQSALIEPVAEGLAVAVLIGVMLLSFQSQIELSVLISFIFMLYRLQPQVQKLNYNVSQVVLLSHSIREVYALLDRSDKEYIAPGNISFTGLKQGIRFDQVSFFYPAQKQPALDCLSLHIPKGKTTAFVGSSGAGKTTLINLILRFYDADSGEIYVDDYPITQLTLASWRSRIATVSQDVHIFSTTVRENIAYGRPDATEAEIIVAAKQACAHEFICQLPQGYDTFVGDRGIMLSGGQRQRISIARAILCDPEILILDEATNSLDNLSELSIQRAIQSLSRNRTVIVIAHRLSTIEEADSIVVMEQGRVVEQGSFQDLLQQQGLFAQLHHRK